jgi:ribosome-binding ATPase YchF (GTP1/OBG family)
VHDSSSSKFHPVLESRAWNIPKGTIAKDAAGEIHSDFSKRFIRAEVFPYFIDIHN